MRVEPNDAAPLEEKEAARGRRAQGLGEKTGGRRREQRRRTGARRQRGTARMATPDEVSAMRALFQRQNEAFEQQQKAFAENEQQQRLAFEQQQKAFAESEERRAREAAQLLTQNNALASRIEELLALGQQEHDRRLQLERELAEERLRSTQSRPLVDVSKLGQNKPEKFTEKEEAWANWSWHYRNYLAAANLTAREAMKFAESSGHTPVDEDEVKRRGWHAVSDQLYSSLVGFTQDKSESSSLVRNTAEGQGLEAWRKLVVRWHTPALSQDRVLEKEQLMALKAVPDNSLGRAIEEWEVLRKEWEEKHNTTLDEDSAQLCLLRLCSGELRKHLNLHYTATDYKALRKYLTDYLRKNRLPVPGQPGSELLSGRSAGGRGTSSSSSSGPAPMDLSALLQQALDRQQAQLLAALGKGGGKAGGKGGANGARGGGAGGATGAAPKAEPRPRGATATLHPWQPTEREKQLECRVCGRKGHTERTCFERHPELKQQAQEHAKEKKKTKRLAALSTTPAEAGDSVLLAALPAAPAARPLPAAEDHAQLLATLNRGEQDEQRKLFEETSRTLCAYLLNDAELGNPEEEQALTNTLAKLELPNAGTEKPPSRRSEKAAKNQKTSRRTRTANGILWDTAAGASCVPEKAVAGRTPLPGVRGPELETASGEAVRGGGEMHELQIHTGDKLLPARLTAADVVQPILAAAEYCGPGGEFEATLRPENPELCHKPTGTVFPLRWEDKTLKLAPATGATEEASKLDAKLAAALRKKATTGVVRAEKKTGGAEKKEKSKPPRQTEKEKTKEEQKKLRTAALQKVKDLGSTTFRLSRLHLLALARALGVRAAGGKAPSKKELFRLVTGELPDGAGRGLRPGRPGKGLL